MEIALPFIKALGALVIILASCELFTNGIEWLGCRLNLSKGAVGSVLAAVGTALPETLVPIVAILFIGGAAASEIGIGAILGAPFMLATLAFAVTGISAYAFRQTRTGGLQLNVCAATLSQDFAYFFVVYVLAVGVSPVLAALKAAGLPAATGTALRIAVALLLVAAYVVYVRRHLARVDEDEEEDELAPLYFQRSCDLAPRMRFVYAQILTALVAIIAGAHLFVSNLEHIAETLSVSPLILSLVITPIATELPEKFNSILWVRRGKDTLALGNISGAMVFQSCIPVAIGIVMTDWALDVPALVSAGAALLSSAAVYGYLRLTGRLDARVLLVGLPLYAVFLAVAFGAI